MNDSLARRVLGSMRCGVIAVDREGRVTLLNDQAARYLQLAPPPAPGADCRQVFAHCPSVAHLLLDALRQSTLPDRAELELHLKGERQILIGFSLSRISDDDGETVGSAIFFKDLTLVEEEREREAMRNRLASLGEVAAQLAHEIRNRLGGIRLFLGLARRRLEGDPDGVAYLDRAESEVLEANGKMGEILDYVRPLKLGLQPAAVEAVCREALDSTLARFPEASIELRWDVERGIPDIPLDGARMRDALANLFANAVEAMQQNGSMTIRIGTEEATVLVSAPGEQEVPGLRGYGESPSRQIRIEIQDDGPGIPPEVMRRIFQPFFTTKERGSGLGISTTQKIVDAHAGSIDVMSWPGGGTRFIVRLPAPSAEEE